MKVTVTHSQMLWKGFWVREVSARCSFTFRKRNKVSWWQIWWVGVMRKHSCLILTLSCFCSLVSEWVSCGTHLADFWWGPDLVKYGEDRVSMEASVTLKRVPDLHPAVILIGDWNKGQEVSVLMAFLVLNRRYSNEMEREAGSGREKCRFLNNQ
jgi:hypothetical protein